MEERYILMYDAMSDSRIAHNFPSEHFLKVGSVVHQAYINGIPIITIDHETGERTHEDGTPLTRPSFLPPSGAPIARLEDSELPDGVTTESVVPKPPDPDSLVAELVKCQAAERILADMPSFEDVLEDERRQVTD